MPVPKIIFISVCVRACVRVCVYVCVCPPPKSSIIHMNQPISLVKQVILGLCNAKNWISLLFTWFWYVNTFKVGCIDKNVIDLLYFNSLMFHIISLSM